MESALNRAGSFRPSAFDHIRNLKGQDDPIYFMDATHPQHNPVLAVGWIKRGEEQVIPTNTGRRRVNINGAIDLERLEPVVRFDDAINADSTIALKPHAFSSFSSRRRMRRI